MSHARKTIRVCIDKNWMLASKACAHMDEEMLDLIIHCYTEDQIKPPRWIAEFRSRVKK